MERGSFLTASRAIYNLGGAGNDFSQVQIYYYIAVGFAGVTLLSSLLLNYRHAPDSLQQVKTKTTPQQAGSAALGTTLTKHQFKRVIMFVIGFFLIYMLVETTFKLRGGHLPEPPDE